MGVNKYFSELALSEEDNDFGIAPAENNPSLYFVSLSEIDAGKKNESPGSQNAIIQNIQQSNGVTLDYNFFDNKKDDLMPNKMKLRSDQTEEIKKKNSCNRSKVVRTPKITAKMGKGVRQTSISANLRRADKFALIENINSRRQYNRDQSTLKKGSALMPKETLETKFPSSNQSGHLALESETHECDNAPLLSSIQTNLFTDINYFKDKGVTIVDPVRAALTWQDDEITGYNVIDPEDDGEGINGIGFRPTPMESYIRIEKRKKQLAAYRDQQAKDARSLRRERRNCPHIIKKGFKEDQTIAKRVRFEESKVKNISD